MSGFDLSKVIRPHVLALKPYSSARDEYSGHEGVFLDANENPLGSVGGGNYNRYPDPYQQEIKKKLAIIKGVQPQQIFLGNGSDEAIDLLIRAFCEPKEEKILITPPTYGMYRVSADVNLVEVKEVPLSPDFNLQVDEILKELDELTKLVFLCSPNNPTGNSLRKADVEKVLEKAKGVVVVDEAYIDFSAEESYITLLDRYPNLVVMQTFSKAWGLAGLRLGMAFASPELIGFINKIKPPYNINQLTQEKALESLGQYTSQKKMVEEILKERKGLAEELKSLPTVRKIYPSDANFLLVKIDDATEVYNKLVSKHVIVRNRSSVQLCADCLRITVGSKSENNELLKSLRELF
ncbi:histidinol-phosphate transaminase [Flammeovirgaceae bacterium SG7u.111]|nr:histidinol-phosphate transaminase [Flammeovirgaceae bacterium SG7u.132]WPO38597.1 histidinol-phosphate transaminase [Flammeovirgaceae bacterium SG7u.111]